MPITTKTQKLSTALLSQQTIVDEIELANAQFTDTQHSTLATVSIATATLDEAFAKPMIANAIYKITPAATSVNEGVTTTFSLKTSKVADGTVLSYSLSGNGITASDVAGGLTGNVTVFGNSAKIKLTVLADKTTEGNEALTISLFNQSTLVATSAITIVDTSINHAPTYTTSNVTLSVIENTTSVYTAQANDVDGNALTYTLAGSDASLFNIQASTGAVSFKSAPNFEVDNKTYNFDVIATDNATPALSVTQKATVTLADINEAPNFANANASLFITENSTAKIDNPYGVATDVDSGDFLSYSLSGIDAALFDVDNTGAIRFKVGANFEAPSSAAMSNNYAVNLIATDLGGLHASQAVNIAVSNINEAPTLLSQPEMTVKSGSTVSLDLSQYVSDPDSSFLLWTSTSTSTNKGGAVSINMDGIATVSYSQNGGAEALGNDSFSFAVTDASGKDNTIYANVNIMVSNTAPQAANINSGNAPELAQLLPGQTVTIDVLGLGASDADGNTLTAAIVPASFSAGGSAEIVAGQVHYTPALGFAGEETFAYTVSDGFGGLATANVTVTVLADNIGTSGNDLIYGSSRAEVIHSLDGNDSIFGGGGNDVIDAGAGNDTIMISSKWTADPNHLTKVTINGGAGFDTISVYDAAEQTLTDTAFAHIRNIESVALGTNTDGQNLRLGMKAVAAGVVEVTAANLGANQRAVIDASGMFDNAGIAIIGGAGADLILGSMGNDTISGGGSLGNDVITGGAGADLITLSPSAAAQQIVRINLNADVASGTLLADADVYTGFTVGKHFIDLSGAVLQSSGGWISSLSNAFVTSSGTTPAETNDGHQATNNLGVEHTSASVYNFANFGAISNQDTVAFNLTSDIVTGEQDGVQNSLLNQAGLDEAISYITNNFGTSTVANVNTLLLVTDGTNQAIFHYQEGSLDQGIQASELSLVGVFAGTVDITAASII